MTTRLIRCLKHLEATGFFSCSSDATTPNIKLLSHGSAYAQQLQQHWLKMRHLAVNLDSHSSTETLSLSRFRFVHSQLFSQHFQQLRKLHPSKAKCPTLLKQQHTSETVNNHHTIFQLAQPVTHLITDFFVEPHRGLEHFYNVQRESKIWWMRYSSNPSRYAIVPQPDLEKPADSQAIDIRASFGQAGSVTVEQLSLVHLPTENKDFQLPDARTGIPHSPAVIRSVIELEPASCALLLDGCDHGRETRSLLLNRVLAPYQCAVAGIKKTEHSSEDLHDLCAHVSDVLLRARLRLQTEGYALSTDSAQLTKQLETYDRLGVPYTLLLDDQQTLSNGLLQLRSRDTQLAETVHISDLPDYLLNIFRDY